MNFLFSHYLPLLFFFHITAGMHTIRSILYTVGNLKAYKFIKKKLQHSCFPVKFRKFFRTPLFYRTPPIAASIQWYTVYKHHKFITYRYVSFSIPSPLFRYSFSRHFSENIKVVECWALMDLAWIYLDHQSWQPSGDFPRNCCFEDLGKFLVNHPR